MKSGVGAMALSQEDVKDILGRLISIVLLLSELLLLLYALFYAQSNGAVNLCLLPIALLLVPVVIFLVRWIRKKTRKPPKRESAEGKPADTSPAS